MKITVEPTRNTSDPKYAWKAEFVEPLPAEHEDSYPTKLTSYGEDDNEAVLNLNLRYLRYLDEVRREKLRLFQKDTFEVTW